jgi:hypothetical protein
MKQVVAKAAAQELPPGAGNGINILLGDSR